MLRSALLLGGLATTALSAPTVPRSAAAQPQQKRTVSLPLHRRSAIVPDSHLPPHKRSVKLDAAGLDEALERIGREAERVRGKYGRTLSSKKAKTKRASAEVTLFDADQDLEYFITMQIGTPAQSLNVTVDTGSADLWVPSQQCSEGCASNTTFYDTSSTSLTQERKTITVQYGSGEVQGEFAYETVSLGDGLSVNKTGFIVAEDIQSLLQSDVPVSGLMGFGWATIAESGATPYWEQVLVNGTSASSFDQPAFSMSLARAPGARTGQQVYGEVDTGGSFILGGWDESQINGGINSVEWNNLTAEGYWEIPITAATINGQAVTLNSMTGAIDSGTTLIAVPESMIQAIYADIDGAQEIQGGNGLWAYPQSSDAAVSLTFAGKAWPINSDDFCYYSTEAQVNGQSGTYCVGAFFDGGSSLGGASEVPDWIVGDAFLKNVYTIYRASPASVGFGELSSGAASSSNDSTGGALALAAGSKTVLAAAAAAGAWMML